MKKLIGTIVGVALIGLATASMAQPWGRGPAMGMGYGMNPYMAAQLGFTPEQTSQLRAMGEALFKELAPLQESLFSKGQELRLLWAGPNPDQGQIAAKQKEITDLQAQIQEISTRHRLEARKGLTPEQQEKISSFMGGRGFGPGPGWGRGRMGGRW